MFRILLKSLIRSKIRKDIIIQNKNKSTSIHCKDTKKDNQKTFSVKKLPCLYSFLFNCGPNFLIIIASTILA